MNSRVKSQLDKCKITLPEYTDDTTQIIVPKQESPIFQENHCYQITVEDYIVHPYSTFSLHDNWNNGIAPTDINMNVEVKTILNNMIKVYGLGVSDNKVWEGWLPVKSIIAMKELK